MDYLASYSLLPLRLAGNQLIINIPSPETVLNRAELLYKLELYQPEAYQSGSYMLYERLRGRERPVTVIENTDYSEGAYFDVSEYFWSLLSPTPPKSNQAEILLQALATMPVYWKQLVTPYESETTLTSPIQYIIRGKIHEDQFPGWKDSFFTEYLTSTRQFYTWQPRYDKLTDRSQPEFLSYLVHHNPCPSELRVRVNIEYQDGTFSTTTLTPITLSNVYNYTLYTIPVGFNALKLDENEAETEKTIHRYTVWLSNQNNQRLTEERYYIVNNDYVPYVRHLVFLNSLGGFDSIRLYGVSSTQLKRTSALFQRELEAGYSPSSEELFVRNITGERTLTLNTGYLPNREWLDYFEELMWSEQIYVDTAEGLIPIVLTQDTYAPPNDEEDIGGRTFVFRRSKTALAYSALPAAPVTVSGARPTFWAGSSPYCLVNEKGIRTGYQVYSSLELRYSDGLLEKVPGVARKSNIPGTEGYIPPQQSSYCNVTPYLSAEISRIGTFSRNNCGQNYIGEKALIVIAAQEFGSESSQAEADTRAESAWSLLNTQERANQYGACTLSIFYSVAVSQLSTYSKNTCSGNQYGSPWTITVQAGAYTSNISQADANNQAIAYANSLDTQANANLYALCRNLWDYDYNVPSGYFHFRSNRPNETKFYLIKSSGKWQGHSGAFAVYNHDSTGVYPDGTNDIDFIASEITQTGITLYNLSGSDRTASIYVYKNGILNNGMTDVGPIIAGENYGVSFVNVAQITDGAKFYVRVVWN